MKMTPVWKSAAFWSTVVASVVAIVAGLNYQMEAEMVGAVAAIVIGYLVSRGYVAGKVAEAGGQKLAAGGEPKDGEINF